MQNRIFSRRMSLAAASIGLVTALGTARAQTPGHPSNYMTDPATGIVYRPETRTVETPVVDTHVRKEERVLYRPQTVTNVTNEARTTYTPVVEYKWEPRLHGRWNPFTQPTVAYHHVPVSRWEARSEVIPRTTTRTHWVAEKQVVDVPTRLVRIHRESKTDYVAVGKVAPPPSQHAAAPSQHAAAPSQPPTAADALAARLRPLDSRASIVPLGATALQPLGTPQTFATSLQSSGASRLARGAEQTGMRPTELYPSAPATPMLPPTTNSGIAGMPMPLLWR